MELSDFERSYYSFPLQFWRMSDAGEIAEATLEIKHHGATSSWVIDNLNLHLESKEVVAARLAPVLVDIGITDKGQKVKPTVEMLLKFNIELLRRMSLGIIAGAFRYSDPDTLRALAGLIREGKAESWLIAGLMLGSWMPDSTQQ
jgi:hypothetical protein